MIQTPIVPYRFVVSHVIKNDVIKRKGIVSAVRGETRDRSPYFTALRAAIVVIAFKNELMNNIQINSVLILEYSMKNNHGRRIKNDSKRVPHAREYSSRESFFLISVNDFPASSQSDLRKATIIANSIPNIFSRY